jgi:hypothetical protein
MTKVQATLLLWIGILIAVIICILYYIADKRVENLPIEEKLHQYEYMISKIVVEIVKGYCPYCGALNEYVKGTPTLCVGCEIESEEFDKIEV